MSNKNSFITQAFKQFGEILDEELDTELSVQEVPVYTVDDTAHEFLDTAGEDESVDIIDLEAETVEDLKQSYVGKVVLDCNVCHSNIFIDKDEVTVDEDGVANIDMECPYCISTEGYTIIGKIAPYEDEEEVEIEEEPEEEIEIEEVEPEEESEEDEELEEGLISKKAHAKGYSDVYDGVARGITTDNEADAITDELDKQLKESCTKRRSLNESIPIANEFTVAKVEWSEYDDDLVIWEDTDGDYWWVDRDGPSEHEFSSIEDAVDDYKFNWSGEYDAIYFLPEYSYLIDEYNDKDFLLESCKSKKEIKESANPTKFLVTKIDLEVSNENYDDMLIPKGSKVELVSMREDECPVIRYKGEEFDIYAEDEDEWNEFFVELLEQVNECNNRKLKEGLTSSGEWWEKDWDEDDVPDTEHLLVNEFYAYINGNDKEFDAEIQYSDVDPEVYVGLYEYDDSIASCTFNRNDRDEEGIIEEANRRISNWCNSDMSSRYLEGLQKYKHHKLSESIEDVQVTTEDETMTMTTKEDGGVVIETSPKEDFEEDTFEEETFEEPEMGGEEMIAPIEDSDEEEVELNSEVDALNDEDIEALEEPDEIDIEDFDEDSFDELGESYLTKHYDNVEGFKTVNAKVLGDSLIIEGVIRFNSGNSKCTSFVFNATQFNTKNKSALFEGYNRQISRGKKTFKMNCLVESGRIMPNKLTYNYRTRNELNESIRVSGTCNVRKK